MDKPTGRVRVAPSYPHKGRDEVRVILDVEVYGGELDDTKATHEYWVELHTAAGVVARLDLRRTGQLVRELQQKQEVAAEMERSRQEALREGRQLPVSSTRESRGRRTGDRWASGSGGGAEA